MSYEEEDTCMFVLLLVSIYTTVLLVFNICTGSIQYLYWWYSIFVLVVFGAHLERVHHLRHAKSQTKPLHQTEPLHLPVSILSACITCDMFVLLVFVFVFVFVGNLYYQYSSLCLCLCLCSYVFIFVF
jgi:hypothetical protein